MRDGVLFGPLILFAATMCLTPGPNVVMITASAVNFGFRRAIPHVLGVTFGFGFLVMAVGLGFARLLQAEPRLHVALKYAGAAYLLYLAWRIAHTAGRDAPAREADHLHRGCAVPVDQSEGMGDRGRRARGLHECE